jgi:hypothetical protein
MRFALGRYESDADACSVETVERALDEPDDLRAAILAIVTSDSFRHRRATD